MAHWDELPAEIRLMILEHVADLKPEFCGLKSRPENQTTGPYLTLPQQAQTSIPFAKRLKAKWRTYFPRRWPRTRPAVNKDVPAHVSQPARSEFTDITLATLATVSREWQYYFETVTFSRLVLRLDSNDFNSLSSAVTGTYREALVRHISISVDDDGIGPYSDSSGALRLTRPISLGEAIRCLFLCLQKWQSSTHPGLTLELCVSHWESLAAFPGQDAILEWKWNRRYRLPAAQVVTGLILPRQETPIMKARRFRYVLDASPRLESFRWEIWRHYGWVGNPSDTGLAFFQRLSSTVKSISLFSDERPLARIGYGEDPKLWCAEFSHWVAMALARRDNTQLKHLSVCYMTDASTLLDIALQTSTKQEWEEGRRLHRAAPGLLEAPVDHPIWERLETLTLKSTLLAPSSKEEEADAAAAQINGLILKAGQLAKRSLPKLRTLEIWNGANPLNADPYFSDNPPNRNRFGFIFRYSLSTPPPPPKTQEENGNIIPTWRSDAALLEFKSSWHFTPSKKVLAIWEEVAAMQTRQLKVSVEYVDGFKTGGCLAVMKDLVTRKLVVSEQVWDQIQTDGITGHTVYPRAEWEDGKVSLPEWTFHTGFVFLL
ncbi:hypothetical protein V8F06_000434 [Rhypophila decipiens]